MCILNAPEVVSINKLILVNKGQGEGDTIWNGWAWCSIVLKKVSFFNLLTPIYNIFISI